MADYGKAVDGATVINRLTVSPIAFGIGYAPRESLVIAGGLVALGLVPTLLSVTVHADGLIDAPGLDDLLAVRSTRRFSPVWSSSATRRRAGSPSSARSRVLFGGTLAAGIAIAPVRYLDPRKLFQTP